MAHFGFPDPRLFCAMMLARYLHRCVVRSMHPRMASILGLAAIQIDPSLSAVPGPLGTFLGTHWRLFQVHGNLEVTYPPEFFNKHALRLTVVAAHQPSTSRKRFCHLRHSPVDTGFQD